jgi:hypothetical protein
MRRALGIHTPPVRPQLLKAQVRLSGQLCQDHLEIGPRSMPIEFGQFDPAHQAVGALIGLLAAHKPTVVAPQRHRAHGVGRYMRCDLWAAAVAAKLLTPPSQVRCAFACSASR